MDYVKTVLEKAISVDSIVSIHYYEYPIDFAFSGEIHDFWEIVYADKGDAIITAGSRELCLPRGHLFLHEPMEYHNIRCPESSTVNSFIVSFCCDDPLLYCLAGRPIACGGDLQALMTEIITEARGAFAGPLDEVIKPQLERRQDAVLGSEQMLQLHLERMLLLLLRGEQAVTPPDAAPAASRHRGDALLQSVCKYLEEHLAESLQMETLCREFSVSKSTLQKLFRSRIGHGISRHYQQLKIDRAKALIREKKYNFTEIAQQLGYSSVHYFSRHFKQIAGMTPSEYAASIKAMMGDRI